MNFSTFFIDGFNGTNKLLDSSSKKSISNSFLFSDIIKVCEGECGADKTANQPTATDLLLHEVTPLTENVIQVSGDEINSLSKLITQFLSQSNGTVKVAKTTKNFEPALFSKKQFVLKESDLKNFLAPLVGQISSSNSTPTAIKSGTDKNNITDNSDLSNQSLVETLSAFLNNNKSLSLSFKSSSQKLAINIALTAKEEPNVQPGSVISKDVSGKNIIDSAYYTAEVFNLVPQDLTAQLQSFPTEKVVVENSLINTETKNPLVKTPDVPAAQQNVYSAEIVELNYNPDTAPNNALKFIPLTTPAISQTLKELFDNDISSFALNQMASKKSPVAELKIISNEKVTLDKNFLSNLAAVDLTTEPNIKNAVTQPAELNTAEISSDKNPGQILLSDLQGSMKLVGEKEFADLKPQLAIAENQSSANTENKTTPGTVNDLLKELNVSEIRISPQTISTDPKDLPAKNNLFRTAAIENDFSSAAKNELLTAQPNELSTILEESLTPKPSSELSAGQPTAENQSVHVKPEIKKDNLNSDETNFQKQTATSQQREALQQKTIDPNYAESVDLRQQVKESKSTSKRNDDTASTKVIAADEKTSENIAVKETQPKSQDDKDQLKHHTSDSAKNTFQQEINTSGDVDLNKLKLFSELKNVHEPVKTIKTSEIIQEFTKFVQQGEKQSISFQLTPENLGKVKLVVDLVAEQINTRIEVENEQVKQFIQSNIEQLKQSLQSSGIQISNVSISLKDFDQQFSKNSTQKKKINARISKISEENIQPQTNQKLMGYNTYEFLA